mmetsp:Transcript_9798/g.24218  ORF Transcript_9798/g.24218 Transcript_9798/m.24218 type:complete len:214 (-) Transcript_9798:511-1152(-)
MAARSPATSPRVSPILYVGTHSSSCFFRSSLIRMSQKYTLPSAEVVAKKLHSPVLGLSILPCGLVTCTSAPIHIRSVTANVCESGSSDTYLGLHTGMAVSSPSPCLDLVFLALLSARCTSVVSHKHTCPLSSPPATRLWLVGLNWNEYTSVGASSTYCGWMGSTKFQMSTAPGLACPLASTRSSNELGSVQDTATTPRLPGSQSTHDTVLPLL